MPVGLRRAIGVLGATARMRLCIVRRLEWCDFTRQRLNLQGRGGRRFAAATDRPFRVGGARRHVSPARAGSRAHLVDADAVTRCDRPRRLPSRHRGRNGASKRLGKRGPGLASREVHTGPARRCGRLREERRTPTSVALSRELDTLARRGWPSLFEHAGLSAPPRIHAPAVVEIYDPPCATAHTETRARRGRPRHDGAERLAWCAGPLHRAIQRFFGSW
jgi:hypothetical protein